MTQVHGLYSFLDTPCIPFEIHYIHYYSKLDMPVGIFLEELCFNRRFSTLTCSNFCRRTECNRPMKDHTRVFLHDGGKMSVSIEEMDGLSAMQRFGIADGEAAESILTWSVCKGCMSQSPATILSSEAWKYSFASYLELCFYSKDSLLAQCGHSLFQQGSAPSDTRTRFFYSGGLLASLAFDVLHKAVVAVPPLYLSPPNSQVVHTNPKVDKLQAEKEQLGLLASSLFDKVRDVLVTLEADFLDDISPLHQNLAGVQSRYTETLQTSQPKLTSLTLGHGWNSRHSRRRSTKPWRAGTPRSRRQ